MAGRNWTEDELRVALYLYFQLPFGRLHSGTPDIIQMAKILDRSPSSVAMKLTNFASLDPKITETGRKGLKGASKLDRSVFEQFRADWSASIEAAETLWNEYQNERAKHERLKDSAVSNFKSFESGTDKIATVKIRKGQEFFRRAVLANYDQCCCITGIAATQLINASHIKPWNIDEKNRCNPANGLPLSATFDRAFDRGLLTITLDNRVRLSRFLVSSAEGKTSEYFTPYQDRSISSAVRFDPDPDFLSWHHKEIFVDDL